MKQASFSLRTVLIIVALLVLLPTAVVLAQEIITSAEPGYVNPPVPTDRIFLSENIPPLSHRGW